MSITCYGNDLPEGPYISWAAHASPTEAHVGVLRWFNEVRGEVIFGEEVQWIVAAALAAGPESDEADNASNLLEHLTWYAVMMLNRATTGGSWEWHSQDLTLTLIAH